MKRPKTIYANRINLSGLYSSKPLPCRWVPEDKVWWAHDRDLCVEKLGIEEVSYCLTFSSASKADVQNWTNGALAVMAALKDWTSQ